MKKIFAFLLTATMLVGLLAACGNKAETPAPETTPPAMTALKTGLGVIATAAASVGAAADDAMAQADVLMAAVLVDADGKIIDCKIDSVQAKIAFGNDGTLRTAADTVFASKNELGEAYGLKKASGIGKEWNEQAAAFAQYVIGKTPEEVAGIAMTDGVAADADLAASVTIHIGDFIGVVRKAAANAQAIGAQVGDQLRLASVAEMSSSKDATAEEAGLAQTYVSMTATTFAGDKISSSVIDAVQVDVAFDQNGAITSDIANEFMTKNELGDAYGMKKASGIGKEWNEQAAAFAQYATGKTIAEIQGIAVSEGRATDADLTASVTIHINVFQSLLEKAANAA